MHSHSFTLEKKGKKKKKKVRKKRHIAAGSTARQLTSPSLAVYTKPSRADAPAKHTNKMHFSNLAIAALITAGAQAACPLHGHHSQRPSGVPSFTRSIRPSAAVSIPSYSFSSVAIPTTLSSVVTPASAPVVVVTTSSSAAAATSTTASSSAAATTSSVASSDASLTTDQSSALSSQNQARSAVSESALTWDAGLASDAQTWADHLASLNSPGSLTHDDQSTEGENLYWSSDSSDPYNAAAEAWIAEKSDYSGEAISTGGNFEEYGHYSK